jgi:hypothetical protein
MSAPVIELFKWWEIWIIAEQFHQGRVASTEQIKKAFCDFTGKGLAFPRRPRLFMVTGLWEGAQF